MKFKWNCLNWIFPVVLLLSFICNIFVMITNARPICMFIIYNEIFQTIALLFIASRYVDKMIWKYSKHIWYHIVVSTSTYVWNNIFNQIWNTCRLLFSKICKNNESLYLRAFILTALNFKYTIVSTKHKFKIIQELMCNADIICK